MTPSPPSASPWSHLRAYLTRRRWSWLFATVAIFVSTLATTVTLSQIKLLVDHALPASLNPATRAAGLQETLVIILGMVVLTLLGVTLMRQTSALITQLAQQLVVELRADYYASLMRQPPAFYRQHEIGRLIATGLNDTETISVFMTQAVPFVLVSVGQLVLAVIFMLASNWALALICITLVTALQAWSLRGIVPRMQRLESAYRQQLGEITSELNEDLLGVRDIQIFTQEQRAAKTYRHRLERLAKTMTLNMSLSVTNFAISTSMTGLGLALVYGVGLLLLITLPGLFGGQVEAGRLASFAAFFAQFTSPIGALSGALLRWQAMLVAARRVFEIMTIRPGVQDRPDAKDPGALKGHIRFENVRFSYEPSNPEAWAMEGLSLEIKPGEKVAFVGGSGSGKSTLLHLVARFHEVTGGRVTIDGYDVRELSLHALRRNIGLVAQNVILFRGSLADNIRFGRPEAHLAAVEAAAMVGYVTEFVDKLDHGYQAQLGEMGQGLSGGQKQRVSIARAALVNPPILLLDEATSALDTGSEAMVTRSLDELSRGRTTLIIAHRLNTIRNADKIIVMGTDSLGNGVIRAAGTHDQLMESSLEYAALYGKQRRKAILMPIGPLYDTTAALPTVLGLALAYKAPVFILDFGPLDMKEAVDRRFGVSVVLTKEDPRVINAKHLRRVNEIVGELTGEGVDTQIVHPPPEAEKLDWIQATLRVIAETDATHLVAVDNVLVPMDKMRESIKLIERKGGVEYILINPIAEVD